MGWQVTFCFMSVNQEAEIGDIRFDNFKIIMPADVDHGGEREWPNGISYQSKQMLRSSS